MSLYEYYIERFSLADTGPCATFRNLVVLKSSDNWNIVLNDLIFSFDAMVTADMLPRKFLSNELEYDIRMYYISVSHTSWLGW